jgi:hypothetical protein
MCQIAAKCRHCGMDSFTSYNKFLLDSSSYIQGRWVVCICELCRNKIEKLDEDALNDTMEDIFRYGRGE